jgi:hypothetical protein
MRKMAKRAYFKKFPITNKFCRHVYCLNVRTGWRDNVWAQSDWVKSLHAASASYAGCPSSSLYPSHTFRTKTGTEVGGSKIDGYRIASVYSAYAVYWRIIRIIASRIIGLNSSIGRMTFQTLKFKEQSFYGKSFQETLWSVTRKKGQHGVLHRKKNKINNNIKVDLGLIPSTSRNAEFCNSIKKRISRL